MSGIMALGSLSLIISLSGCSLVPTVHTPIHKSERGTVALRTFSDQDFQATHPKVLEPTHGQSPAGVTCPGTKGNVSNTYDWGSYNRLKLFQQIKLNFSPRFWPLLFLKLQRKNTSPFCSVTLPQTKVNNPALWARLFTKRVPSPISFGPPEIKNSHGCFIHHCKKCSSITRISSKNLPRASLQHQFPG